MASIVMAKQIVEIDGLRFDSLDGFFDEVSEKLIPGLTWGRNLGAFNDILSWRDEAYVLRWLNSDRSRDALGYSETIRWLEHKREICHPLSVEHVDAELAAALRGEGPTLFDTLIEIIRFRGLDTDAAVELELK